MKTQLIIAVAAFALAAPATAAEFDSVAVKYADLDLRSEAGLAHLNRRLTRAAEQVCGFVGSRALGEIQRVRECREEVLLNAYADVERALASKSGGDVRLAQNLVRRAR